MIDLDIGGPCPRQPLTRALMALLGLPRGGTGTDCFVVGFMDGPNVPGIEESAHHCVRQRQDLLLCMFADEQTATCSMLTLLWRTVTGTSVIIVEPCAVADDAPLVLVSLDRTEAFALDHRCALARCEVPREDHIDEGIEKAWKAITTQIRLIQTDPDSWSHGVLTPFCDPSARELSVH